MRTLTIAHLVLLLVLSTAVTALSQDFISIKGVVMDGADSSPLAYVHVYSPSEGIGTRTNEAGEFELHLPDSLQNAMITFSSIGYKSEIIPLTKLNQTSVNVVLLEPHAYLLEEVIVSANKMDTLAAFVEKAISHIKSNYAAKPYYLQAFYRELSLQEATYSRLIEAAVDIQDRGYNRAADAVKITVRELRKSEDFLKYSWSTKLYEFIVGSNNQLVKTVKTDYVRQRAESGVNVLNDDFLVKNTFVLDSMVASATEPVAVISFRSLHRPESGPSFEGRLYINTIDYGILRIEYNWVVPPGFKIPRQEILLYQDKYFFKKTVEYAKFNGKYYLSYINVFDHVPGAWGADTADGMKKQWMQITLFVNQIFTDKNQYDRIRARDRQKSDEDLYDQKFKYHPEFWRHYNVLLLKPLDESIKTDLERERTLDEQFKKSGE